MKPCMQSGDIPYLNTFLGFARFSMVVPYHTPWFLFKNWKYCNLCCIQQTSISNHSLVEGKKKTRTYMEKPPLLSPICVPMILLSGRVLNQIACHAIITISVNICLAFVWLDRDSEWLVLTQNWQACVTSSALSFLGPTFCFARRLWTLLACHKISISFVWPACQWIQLMYDVLWQNVTSSALSFRARYSALPEDCEHC